MILSMADKTKSAALD